MNSLLQMGDSFTCCLCHYKALSEFDLEAHIDYSHADIFRSSANANADTNNDQDQIRIHDLDNRTDISHFSAQNLDRGTVNNRLSIQNLDSATNNYPELFNSGNLSGSFFSEVIDETTFEQSSFEIAETKPVTKNTRGRGRKKKNPEEKVIEPIVEQEIIYTQTPTQRNRRGRSKKNSLEENNSVKAAPIPPKGRRSLKADVVPTNPYPFPVQQDNQFDWNNTNANTKTKTFSSSSTFSFEGSQEDHRGRKRVSSSWDFENERKRFKEEQQQEQLIEKPVIQAASFIEALGKFLYYLLQFYLKNLPF